MRKAVSRESPVHVAGYCDHPDPLSDLVGWLKFKTSSWKISSWEISSWEISQGDKKKERHSLVRWLVAVESA